MVQLNENGQKYARDTVQPQLDLEKRVYALVGRSEMNAMSAAMDHFNRAFEDTLGEL